MQARECFGKAAVTPRGKATSKNKDVVVVKKVRRVKRATSKARRAFDRSEIIANTDND